MKKKKVTAEAKTARIPAPSPYRAMWLIAMFDLPVKTSLQRKAYVRFQKSLIKDGFLRLQFSVYGRYCSSEDATLTHIGRISAELPSKGEVRIVKLTDLQFGKMICFRGKSAVEPEDQPKQLEFL